MSSPHGAASDAPPTNPTPGIHRLLYVSDAAVADVHELQPAVRAIIDAATEVYVLTPTLPGRLFARPPVSDLFGVKGREWLRGLDLPVEESETVAACMRHVEFLDAEIAEVERLVALDALESGEMRRLMTVLGVNVICAATFLAAVGDIRRFSTSRKLVGYLGLDPRVYQSGSAPAKGGRISKQGSPSARCALVEEAWSVGHHPGPLHAFYERIRARRGNKIAVVAAARKLAVLFWSLLSRGEDYAHQQPSLTAKKLRLLEIRAGAPTLTGGDLRPSKTNSRPIQCPKSVPKPRPGPLTFIGRPKRDRVRPETPASWKGAASRFARLVSAAAQIRPTQQRVDTRTGAPRPTVSSMGVLGSTRCW